jgi:uncharacterized protein (DUF342 family)
VIIDRANTLRLISPLQISKDKTSAFYIIFPTKLGKIPSYTDIDEVLTYNKIITPVDKKDIEAGLSAILSEEKKVTRLKVAQSKGPVNGRDEYYVPLIEITRKAGKELSDGRMDFKEVDSIIEVKKNTEVLRRFPEIKASDGYNVYGEKVAAEMLPAEGYQRGEGIVQSGRDESIFIAAVDGCLEIDKKKISVVPVAIIKGDVDYASGNIEFNGSVHVKGSVLPGFHVKAQGDVIIEKNVDDALIEAQGSVTIRMGISGKGTTKIIAGGTVRTKYILNSSVEAGGPIEVEDSIINSHVFSNDRVSVVSKHAKIMGGEVLARHVIEANTAGSDKETTTVLTVGRNLEVERELMEVRKKMNECKERIAEVTGRIQTSFGTALFENPKKFISVLPDIKKKQCIQLLSELTQANAEMKQLQVEGMKIEEKLVLDEEPVIIIKVKVFRGTVLNIRKRTRKVEEEITNAKFFEDQDEKVIRFCAAV